MVDLLATCGMAMSPIFEEDDANARHVMLENLWNGVMDNLGEKSRDCLLKVCRLAGKLVAEQV